ncbi:Ferredoxin [Flavobacterium beibuense]|uniref:Ferredoxin n=2 Tax=Flavobacterium beibuense TaxID=657326 RepID=A0A444WED4_9FLAO|nr:Ferredoxin [Flavobacterium beibuense]
MHLFLCNGGSCKAKGAEESTLRIRSLLSEKGISDRVHTTITLCNGRCNDGPVVISQPDGIWFKEITADACMAFVNSYIMNGETPESIRLYKYGDAVVNTAEIKVGKAQVKKTK